MVSHDIEFCAKYADFCALFFDGGIVTKGTPKEFFSGNSFYTTAANRMARHMLPKAVTAEDVIKACEGRVQPETDIDDFEDPLYSDDSDDGDEEDTRNNQMVSKKSSNLKRRFTAIISLIVLIITIGNGFPIISDIAWSGLINGERLYQSLQKTSGNMPDYCSY